MGGWEEGKGGIYVKEQNFLNLRFFFRLEEGTDEKLWRNINLSNTKKQD